MRPFAAALLGGIVGTAATLGVVALRDASSPGAEGPADAWTKRLEELRGQPR